MTLTLRTSGLVFLIGMQSPMARSADDTLARLKLLTFEELLDLEVTSVSRRPERLLEAASAIQVITGEDIRRSGAATIPDALRLAGNLQVAQKSSRAWAISARGFNTDLANKLLVLIDGRAVYTPLFSGVFWERQDYLLGDLDRIEVISGPGGTLWGANAVNGVINIMTKSARDTQGLHWEADGGTELRGFTEIRYGGMLAPDVHYRVYGKYAEWDGAELADGSDAMGDWQRGQAGFRIDAGMSALSTLTLQGDIYGSQELAGLGATVRENGHNLLGRWTQELPNGSDLNVQMYYDRTSLNTPTPPFVINGIVFAPAGTLRDDLDIFDVDLQHNFRAGSSHQFVWGLGYRLTKDVLANSPGLAFFPPKLIQDLFSSFVQDEIRLRENLTLTLGTKVEHNDYTGWETEPGARLHWQLTSNHMVWAAVSRAVRMPSRIDRDLSQPAPGFLVVLQGGPDFESETVTAYELGYRGQVGERVSVSASGYFNEYRDLRSTSLTPTTILPFFFANNLEGRTHGLELDVSYRANDWWWLYFNYNYFKSDLRVRSGGFDFNNALNETADPAHQFSLRSSFDLPQGWELDAMFRWVDHLTINNSGTPAIVPAYAELDLRLGWQPSEHLSLDLVGRNLLHGRHPEYGVPGPARKEIERSVHGRVTWHF